MDYVTGLRARLDAAIWEQDRAHKAESNCPCPETMYVAGEDDSEVKRLRRELDRISR